MADAVVQHRNQVQWASGIVVLAAIWLAVSPFILGPAAADATWNNLIVGVIIAIMALARATGGYNAAWLSWGNVLLAIWAFFSPWAFDFPENSELFWSNLITAVVIAACAAWSALATQSEPGRAM